MKNRTGICTFRHPILLLASCGVLLAGQALAADTTFGMSNQHDHNQHGAAADNEHQNHRVAATNYKRVEAAYKVPSVTLVRQDGSKAPFPAELDDGKPVILDFTYTTCTVICPVLSHTFAKVQEKLGSEASKVHMVTISIDPEFDTPARLVEFAKKFRAGPQWIHYTGSTGDVVAIQNAFDVYRGDKMNHPPAIFLRASPDKPWLRIDGFATPNEVIREYRNLLGKS